MSLMWEEYLSNGQYKADNLARREFGENIMLAFKQKNISEGVQWFQAIHLHARLRAWEVTYPMALAGVPGLEVLAGATKTVDIVNMIYAGDIETACLAASYGQPDAMTSPEHWLSDERRLWLVNEMKRWLGWS